MPVNSLLAVLETLRSILAVARQHIEAELRVIHLSGERLERQKARGLLLKFIQTGLPALAGGLKYLHYTVDNRERFLNSSQDRCDYRRSRMSDDMNGACRRSVFFRFDQRRPYASVWSI